MTPRGQSSSVSIAPENDCYDSYDWSSLFSTSMDPRNPEMILAGPRIREVRERDRSAITPSMPYRQSPSVTVSATAPDDDDDDSFSAAMDPRKPVQTMANDRGPPPDVIPPSVPPPQFPGARNFDWAPTKIRLAGNGDGVLLLPEFRPRPAAGGGSTSPWPGHGGAIDASLLSSSPTTSMANVDAMERYHGGKEGGAAAAGGGTFVDEDDASRMRALDRYLAGEPRLASSAKAFLYGPNVRLGGGDDATHSCDGIGDAVKTSAVPSEVRHYPLTSTNAGRVLNVLQGEVAHADPSRADVLVSDDATTCHVLALWSERRWHEEGGGGEDVDERGLASAAGAGGRTVLASVAHVDAPAYGSSLKDAVLEHRRYHSDKRRKREAEGRLDAGDGMIEMSVHVVGGFSDADRTSLQITDHVLRTLADLAEEFDGGGYDARGGAPTMRLRMTLETCVVSGSNDDGAGRPLARGAGLNVSTGQAYLASVAVEPEGETLGGGGGGSPHTAPVTGCGCFGRTAGRRNDRHDRPRVPRRRISGTGGESAEGPAALLRSTRLWAAAFYRRPSDEDVGFGQRLSVVHRASGDDDDDDDGGGGGVLTVEPFDFGPHPYAKDLLSLDDDDLLCLTSTSPDVEKDDFCTKVRATLRHMNEADPALAFGQDVATGKKLSAKFRRVGLNGWVRVQ